MPDQTPEDVHLGLELEGIELEEQMLLLKHDLDMQGLAHRRALITDDSAKLAEIQHARAATNARIEALNPDIRDYNSRLRAHMGLPPVDPDIPQGMKDFLAARFPGAIVIEVGVGSFPFGGFNPTYAPVASWGDENLGGFTAGGVRYGSGSADGPE